MGIEQEGVMVHGIYILGPWARQHDIEIELSVNVREVSREVQDTQATK